MSPVLPHIEHFVFLMLENRSFDNLLGWLYQGEDRPRHIIASPQQKSVPFQGLARETYFNYFADDPFRHYVTYGTQHWDTPSTDPHEPHQHVTWQIFDRLPHLEATPSQPVPGQQATMGGFLEDYLRSHAGALAPYCDEPGWLGALAKKYSQPLTREQALQIMQAYSPEQLPVINGLAKAYAVSDQWFSSVPTQTMANRAFSVCGSSLGRLNGVPTELVDNQGLFCGVVPGRFEARSIWQTLSEQGYATPADWMIYYQSLELNTFCLTRQAFTIPDADSHVAPIQDFFSAIETGTLPSFSYLEPGWYDVMPPWTNGNSYHPPSDVVPGEQFLQKLYDALTKNPDLWRKTVLMITFDEHGGTYDHVPPPWGAQPPWGAGNPPPHALEGGFGFDRFGVRVPTLLISPWINEATVFRSCTDVPYDHTSIIATILKWKGIPKEDWNMGARVDAAPTFEGVLARTTPRTDVPDIQMSAGERQHLATLQTRTKPPITPMQLKVLPFVLQHASGNSLDQDELTQAMADMVKDVDSAQALVERVKAFSARYAR